MRPLHSARSQYATFRLCHVEETHREAVSFKNPDLPRTWTARAIRYQRQGFRPQVVLTSLLDPIKYPAAELVKMYHERWEIELAYDDVKTEMLEREEALRSQKPKGVSQEIFGILLAHNLVRLEMERVAKRHKVEPTRISFVTVLRMIRDAWMWCSLTMPSAIPKNMRGLETNIARCVLPPRRQRSQLRGVKVKMSAYNRVRPGDRAQAARRA